MILDEVWCNNFLSDSSYLFQKLPQKSIYQKCMYIHINKITISEKWSNLFLNIVLWLIFYVDFKVLA